MNPSKFMEFILISDTGKTEVVQICNKRSGFVLGHIRWYGPWRQYCFFPSPSSVFSVWCMEEIDQKIQELTEDHWDRLDEARRGKKELVIDQKSVVRKEF